MTPETRLRSYAADVKTPSAIAASFRDPSGFVFVRDGEVLRQVNASYAEHYDMLLSSGLYATLTRDLALVAHEEVDASSADGIAYKILRPERVPFISYPYEWCFSQLKDAALATLTIQETALDHDMTLKDASAFNIQFLRGRPTLIDTLSFERYVEGRPWVAYRQFCEHFLAPLALMSYCDVRLGSLSQVFLDGVPLDLASSLLPLRTKLRLPLLVHLHLHARLQKHYADRGHAETSGAKVEKHSVSRNGLRGILGSLRSAISSMTWRPAGTEWGEYYTGTNYSPEAMTQKGRLVEAFLAANPPDSVWDLGANTGRFSRLASTKRIPTVAFDVDPSAVEKNYLECRASGETSLLPLVLDLTNPSPSLGWANNERDSVQERGPVHTAMALALVHHLAISNNVPLTRIATFFARICQQIIVEFVPKQDSQVMRLLATREDIFPDYNVEGFESAFSTEFTIRDAVSIEGSERTLYRMTRNGAGDE